ncbi:OmpW/AlkL family protein [Microbulbifer taiwanensis]|uniref:OmpW family protein n=1 Tax=Microbulbifer taiwanensis TaxID=986746 RepID=A0ABW1YSY8_9GAMM|nr:OmpW family outer membrane protein [Microbulbifer taiwanensis]
MRLPVKLLSIILIAVAPGLSLAYETGSKILRFGNATVSPDVSSSPLSLTTDSTAEIEGTSVRVGDNGTLGLTGVYMFSDHWGVEVVAALPFQHDLEVSGLTAQKLDLGQTKHLPPTVLLQWYPMQNASSVQPYVGLGLNYTVFFDEELSNGADDLFATLGATDDAKMSIDSSIGIAAEAGIDMAFGSKNQWMFNLAVWWVDLDTTAEIDVPGVGSVSADVELDPLVYMAGLGYRF